jgi:hypothetical protein
MAASAAAEVGRGEIAKLLITTYDVALHGPPSDLREIPLWPRYADYLQLGTPLGAAIKEGHEELFLELLALPAADKLTSADLCFDMALGLTLLHYAAMLACAGTCCDGRGMTPLM